MGEYVIGGCDHGADYDRHPTVGCKERNPERDGHRTCPSEQDIQGDAYELRTDVMFEPAEVDDDCFSDKCNERATTKERERRGPWPREHGVNKRDDAEGNSRL